MTNFPTFVSLGGGGVDGGVLELCFAVVQWWDGSWFFGLSEKKTLNWWQWWDRG